MGLSDTDTATRSAALLPMTKVRIVACLPRGNPGCKEPGLLQWVKADFERKAGMWKVDPIETLLCP